MVKIIAIRSGKGSHISLNGKSVSNPGAAVAKQEKTEGEKSVKDDRFRQCLKAATRFLSYRPRSESELRERLKRHGYNNDIQEVVIAKLKEQGLVNDLAFARFWVDNRESFSPRSRRLVELELKQKGVASEAKEAINVIDDDDNAYRIAVKKARSLSRLDYENFRRHVGEYLKRRGFSYDVINHTVERVWQGRGGEKWQEYL